MSQSNAKFILKLKGLSRKVSERAVRLPDKIVPPPVDVESDEDDPFRTASGLVTSSGPPKSWELADKVLWAEGDQWPGFVRPSMIGGCKRASYFHLTEAPQGRQRHDPKMVRVLRTGNIYHQMIQNILGNSLDIYFAPESPVWDEQLEIRGKCDGICITRDLSRKWSLEIKTMSSSGFSKLTKPIPKHIWQAHTYSALHNCRWIDLIYICKDNQVWKGWRVEFDQQIWNEIQDWVQMIRDYRDRKVPPEFEAAECQPDFCPYTTHCFALKDKEDAARKKKLLVVR